MDQSRHLDPERLAAFTDGSLPRAERRAVEAHAADCAHCLQLLAAMARTEPSPAPTRWRMPIVLRWAVPLAAAATALALWVNVAQDRPHDDVPLPATVSTARSGETRESESKRSVPESAAADAAQPKSPAAGERRLVGSRDEDKSFRAKAAKENEEKIEEQKEVAPRRDAPAAPPAAAAAPAAMVDRLQSDRRNEAAARSLGARQELMRVEVVSPDSVHRWRATGTVVQHSSDGGNTWSTKAVPLQSEVLAGSSPSPSVCWLVGRAGRVLLTTDGLQWRRLDFPESVDLMGVRAQNEREAEVTTADGRVFRTADGGRTWSLQETSSPSF